MRRACRARMLLQTCSVFMLCIIHPTAYLPCTLQAPLQVKLAPYSFEPEKSVKDTSEARDSCAGGERLDSEVVHQFFQRHNATGACSWTYVTEEVSFQPFAGSPEWSGWCAEHQIAAQEHPILRRPFFLLHPCQTAVIMGLMMSGSREEGPSGARDTHSSEDGGYLARWFSVAGPAVGLRLPMSMWPAALRRNVNELPKLSFAEASIPPGKKSGGPIGRA